jgi:hypothetical protein
LWLQGWGLVEFRPDKIHTILSMSNSKVLTIHEELIHKGFGRKILQPVIDKALEGNCRVLVYCGTEKMEIK